MTTTLASRERGGALSTRLSALAEGVELGRGRIDESALDDANALLGRAGERLRLSSEHTVIAFAGATGSGKSSLFNAVAGIDLSPVGIRRPTTGAAHACVWGLEGSRPLLEWLDIEKRHRYARTTALDGDTGSSLYGLVLLDLPDHDSMANRHREEAERLVAFADLIIWVVDPQKYADAAVHERYLRPSADYRPTTAVVLNQVDLLTAAELQECTTDLVDLLVSEGLTEPRLLMTSAKVGTGLDELRALIGETLTRREAAVDRLSADLAHEVSELGAFGDGPDVDFDPAGRARIVARLDEAAGVVAASKAVEREHWQHGARFVEWPFIRFARAVGHDPFRRVHLDQQARAELRDAPALGVWAQPAMVDNALVDASDALNGEVPDPWATTVADAGRSHAAALPAALGEELAEAPSGRTPLWWWAAGVAQWTFVLAALLALAWAACVLAFGYAGAGSAVPSWVGERAMLGYAVGAFVLALLLGLGASWVGRRLLTREARGRRHVARARMMAGVEAVTERLVFGPMRDELDRYHGYRAALLAARGEAEAPSPDDAPSATVDPERGVAERAGGADPKVASGAGEKASATVQTGKSADG